MKNTRLHQILAHQTAQSLIRKRRTVTHLSGNQVVIDGHQAIQFCSNDYLHLAKHKKILKAYVAGVKQYGLGSGGSPLISGHTKAHAALEQAFADHLNRDSALLFNSGYHANLSIAMTFSNRHNSIIADKYCHASLIDGILLSRAQYHRFRHNDINHAHSIIKKYHNKSSLLISESIFSIQGDIAPVQSLAALANHYQILFALDDAHGIGVLGKNGGGICEHAQLNQQTVPCLITPLGKALNSMGAIVSGSKEHIHALLQYSRTYRYSTALAPAICHATLMALKLIQNESWRRQTLHHLINYFIKEANIKKLALFSSDLTPIKSIIIGKASHALAIQNELLSHGFFVSCIRPPTVAHGYACLRISLNCMHSDNQISHLLNIIKERAEYHESLSSN